MTENLNTPDTQGSLKMGGMSLFHSGNRLPWDLKRFNRQAFAVRRLRTWPQLPGWHEFSFSLKSEKAASQEAALIFYYLDGVENKVEVD